MGLPFKSETSTHQGTSISGNANRVLYLTRPCEHFHSLANCLTFSGNYIPTQYFALPLSHVF